eukprot:CAMPEP_0202704248 /NCGR_PEP_ID=MMETSP1385-20130828/16952_1 /ASSEMBLY_ACC=CAM_ASM_000861 /TAXON_ID=933848 /ORGANISM="Elphidium margaritaceum" /LENGTH=95 /DNA_ID=CAMNT_0049362225 /DNA_START=373 /DNA_END=657 /DNA_ORIENTATION=-
MLELQSFKVAFDSSYALVLEIAKCGVYWLLPTVSAAYGQFTRNINNQHRLCAWVFELTEEQKKNQLLHVMRCPNDEQGALRNLCSNKSKRQKRVW